MVSKIELNELQEDGVIRYHWIPIAGITLPMRTNNEDPVEVEDPIVEDPVVEDPVEEVPFTPKPQVSRYDIDEVDPTVNLSDQTARVDNGMGALAGVGDEAAEGLAGVKAGDTRYGGIDAEVLKKESGTQGAEDYVSPQSMVQGQMQDMLDSDSDYMKTAVRRSDEKAASLGLLGSSMAVGAGERSARESALEVAKQDAKTWADADREEQRAMNEISRMKAEGDVSAVAREHLYDIDTETSRFNSSLQNVLETANKQGNLALEGTLKSMSAQWDAESKMAVTKMEGQLQLLLDNNQINADERALASSQATQVMASVYGTIADLMLDPDFMGAYADDPDGLQAVFNTFMGIGTSQVEFIGAAAGLGGEYMGPLGYVGLLGSFGNLDMSGYVPMEDDD